MFFLLNIFIVLLCILYVLFVILFCMLEPGVSLSLDATSLKIIKTDLVARCIAFESTLQWEVSSCLAHYCEFSCLWITNIKIIYFILFSFGMFHKL